MHIDDTFWLLPVRVGVKMRIMSGTMAAAATAVYLIKVAGALSKVLHSAWSSAPDISSETGLVEVLSTGRSLFGREQPTDDLTKAIAIGLGRRLPQVRDTNAARNAADQVASAVGRLGRDRAALLEATLRPDEFRAWVDMKIPDPVVDSDEARETYVLILDAALEQFVALAPKAPGTDSALVRKTHDAVAELSALRAELRALPDALAERLISVSAAAISLTVGSVPPVPPGFQSRSSDRDRLDGAWIHGPSSGSAAARGLVQMVVGDGGVGKTQLAADVYRGSSAPIRIWVSATTEDAITSGYAHAARQLQLVSAGTPDPDAATALLEWFHGPGASLDWLLVLDDIDLAPRDMNNWWPGTDGPADTGVHRVVATLRRRDHHPSPDRVLVPLDAFTLAEATAYLTGRLTPALGQRIPASALDGAADLAEALGRYPVALAQAAAVILDDTDGQHWTCRSYLDEFRRQDALLDDLFPQDAVTEPGQRTVTATWAIAIERACRDTPAAGRAANLAAWTDPDGAPENLWTSPAALTYLTADGHPAAERTARRALAALNRYNLITLTPDDGPRAVRTHHLAQRATRATIPDPQAARSALAESLVQTWPNNDTLDNWGPPLRANATALLTAAPDPRTDQNLITLVFLMIESLGESGDLAAATTAAADLVQQLTTSCGPQDPRTLAARANHAKWQGIAGDLAAAIPALQQLLADMQTALPVDHPDVLAVRNALASLWGRNGHPHRAAVAHHDLAQDLSRLQGPDHPDTLKARSNHALWIGQAGNTAEAITLAEQVLTDRSRVLGPDHRDTLTSRNNLAGLYGRTGDIHRAITEYQHVVDARTKSLGASHPETLQSRNNLAFWTARSGDTSGALQSFRDLYRDQLSTLGDHHPETLATRHNLAQLTIQDGDTTTGAALLEALLKDQLELLGPDHPHTRRTQAEVANQAPHDGAYTASPDIKE